MTEFQVLERGMAVEGGAVGAEEDLSAVNGVCVG